MNLTRTEVLRKAAWEGTSRVASDGAHNYTCLSCGHQWSGYVRKEWWPIRLRWGSPASSNWFAWHGIDHFKADAYIEQRHLTQVFHLGRLKIVLGTHGTHGAKR